MKRSRLFLVGLLLGICLYAVAQQAHSAQLEEVPEVNWPRTPSVALRYYPYLIWLRNTGGTPVKLDTRTTIALTDGQAKYATAHLMKEWVLPPNDETKLEFIPGDFAAVPPAEYCAVVTLVGPAYEQELTLAHNPVTVVEEKVKGIGIYGFIGWSTNHVISNNDDTATFTSRSQVADQLVSLHLNLKPETVTPGKQAKPTFCDIDGDGDLDGFLVGDGANINFIENIGKRNTVQWAPPLACYGNLSIGMGGGGIAFVDIDGDGDFDLCSGDECGRLWLYRNIGTATVAAWDAVAWPLATIRNSEYAVPAFADIDKDGDFDLLVGCEDGSLWVVINHGTRRVPAWEAPVQIPVRVAGRNSVPALVDIDGDGDFDLVVGSGDGNLTLVKNTGTPTAPSWATGLPYAGIKYQGAVAPAFAATGPGGAIELFLGLQDEGMLRFRNTGNRTNPHWVAVNDTVQYLRAPNTPECYALAPGKTSLVSNPAVAYTGPKSGRDDDLKIGVSFLQGLLFNKAYYNAASVTQVAGKPDGGSSLGIAAGIGIPLTTVFLQHPKVVITDITLTGELRRGETSTLVLYLYNPHHFELFAATPPQLRVTRHGEDISRYFIIDSPQKLILNRRTTRAISLRITPTGDVPPGEIAIEPILRVGPETAHEQNLWADWAGALQWPKPQVLTTTVVKHPYPEIRTEAAMVGVGYPGTSTVRVMLSEQPEEDLTVSIVRSAGDAGIRVQGATSLTFTPENWRKGQLVRFTQEEWDDPVGGQATFNFFADGWRSTHVIVSEQYQSAEHAGANQPDLLFRDASNQGQGIIARSNQYSPIVNTTVGSRAIHRIDLRNVGRQTGRFVLKGEPGHAGWAVRYFDALQEGNDITTNVTGEGWTTPDVAANASITLRVEMVAGSGVPLGAHHHLAVEASAANDPFCADIIQARSRHAYAGGYLTAVAPTELTKHYPGGYQVTTAMISPQGRYVAMRVFLPASLAPEVPDGERSGCYLFDRLANRLQRIHVPGARIGNEFGIFGPDERYMAFVAYSKKDAAAPEEIKNLLYKLYLYDCEQGTYHHVATDYEQTSSMLTGVSISTQARYIAVTGYAGRLFLIERATGKISLINVANDAPVNGYHPVISADGSVIAFTSKANNLVPDDTNEFNDVFVYEVANQRMTRVSVATNGTQGNRESFSPAISADGRRVLFISTSNNLVAGDTNYRMLQTEGADIFLHDRETGVTACVSRNSDGQICDRGTEWAMMSADGRHVAFTANSLTLLPEGSTDLSMRVYVRDCHTGTTELLDHRLNPAQQSQAYYASISQNGRFVAFCSEAKHFLPWHDSVSIDAILCDRFPERPATHGIEVELATQGLGEYQRTGQLTHQTLPGTTQVFLVRITNTGNAAETYRLVAEKPDTTWKVRWIDGVHGGKDITQSVDGGGWLLPEVANGESREFRLLVTTPIAGNEQRRLHVPFMVASEQDPTCRWQGSVMTTLDP